MNMKPKNHLREAGKESETISMTNSNEKSILSKKIQTSSRYCNRRIQIHLLQLILGFTIFIALVVPFFILFCLTQRIQKDFQGLINFSVEQKFAIENLKTKQIYLEDQVILLRQELKGNISWNNDCELIDFSKTDKILDWGNDEDRRTAYYRLESYKEIPCLMNESEYLSRVAAANFFMGYMAGEEPTATNVQMRNKYLEIAKTTISKSLILNKNYSQSWKWYASIE